MLIPVSTCGHHGVMGNRGASIGGAGVGLVRVVHNALELAMEPELWTVDLRDGSQITVLTHGYSVEGTEVVFSLLFKGKPHFQLDTLRIPLALMPEDYS